MTKFEEVLRQAHILSKENEKRVELAQIERKRQAFHDMMSVDKEVSKRNRYASKSFLMSRPDVLPEDVNLYKKIRAYRVAMGMTQKTVATAIGIDYKILSRFERGEVINKRNLGRIKAYMTDKGVICD